MAYVIHHAIPCVDTTRRDMGQRANGTPVTAASNEGNLLPKLVLLGVIPQVGCAAFDSHLPHVVLDGFVDGAKSALAQLPEAAIGAGAYLQALGVYLPLFHPAGHAPTGTGRLGARGCGRPGAGARCWLPVIMPGDRDLGGGEGSMKGLRRGDVGQGGEGARCQRMQ